MNPADLRATAPPLSWRQGLAYGLLGLPLAFAALPLYVALPNHYARDLGLPLASVGALLLLVRVIDAAAEPLLGRFSDRLYRGRVPIVMAVAGVSALLSAVGLTSLFYPMVDGPTALAVWMVAGLLLTSLAHSQLVIAHQAWGVRLGGDAVQRGRIVAWREGLGLIGVVTASVLSVAWGAKAMLVVFALALLLGWMALWRAPRPEPLTPAAEDALKLPSRAEVFEPSIWQPLATSDFRRLLAVFLCNGIASALPAALMLFFAQDRLLASPAQIALCLVLYFVVGALSMPGWLAVVRRIGLERAWLVGMLLAIACFGWTTGLGSGQVLAFAVICALSGVALGADLTLPGALLARLVERHGAQGRREGAYLGWWNLATKLNLALAAGLALPLLQWGGYTPGTQDPLALQRLAWAYALLPCVLKLLAAGLLHLFLIRSQPKGVTP